MFTDKKHNHKHSGPPKGLILLLIGVGILLLAGYGVMLLWNAILTDVLGVNPLSYWQAVGLLLLSRILFGRWGPPSYQDKMAYKKRKEKWQNMTEEERAAFKERWKNRCGKVKDE